MNHAFTKIKAWLPFTEILYIIFFVSLICAFRAITSICTGLILVTGIIQRKSSIQSLFTGNPRIQFAAGCILFFLLQIISLLYTHDIHEGWNDIRIKSGLVFLPLAILCIGDITRETIKKLLFYYCILLFAASFFLLCIAFNEYRQLHAISSFFYHALVKPFGYHAVYFSILIFTTLVFLFENFVSPAHILNKGLLIFLIAFFSLFLLLLSSKLVISFYIIYLIYFLVIWSKKNKSLRFLSYALIFLVFFLSAIILLTKNPVSDRFRDIVRGDPGLAEQDSFSPAVYFNGIQFRLLEWKLVPEILNENHCWWTGVSPGDAQTILNQKYLSKNMYIGAPGRTGHGYLDYNTHSQFLESLLQNGIPGLIVFIGICISLIRIAAQKKSRIVSFTIILLLVYSFIESLFQEQYGIVLFTFLPLFTSQGYDENPGTRLRKENSYNK